MREILFRGKRIDNGEWIEGYFVKFERREIPEIYTGWNCYTLTPECHGIEPSTVGQYTGSIDKNGKKIFEGDIVKTKFGRICKVIFFQSPCYCGIDLIPLEDKHKCPDKFDLYLSDNLEIIGNIHDNPELLNVR